MTQIWDPALYESRHAFVWQAGSLLLDLLEPQPDEFFIEFGRESGQLTRAIAV